MKSKAEIFEFLGRVGIAFYFSAVATFKIMSIIRLFAGSGPLPENWLLSLLSNLASLVFVSLVIAMTIFRLKPSRGAQGIEPRVTAMAATFLMLTLAILPESAPPPAGAAVAGLCFVALGSVLSAYVIVWLGRSFSIMAEARRLITGGPYAIVRHPLYVTETIATVGMVLLNWSLVALALAILQWCLQLRRMRHEERILQAAFPEYSSYAARTPRWLPALPGRRQQTV